MANRTASAESLSIGLDVSDRFTVVVAFNIGGDLVEESRLRNTPAAFRQYFSRLARAKVTLEAGCHSAWMDRVIKQCGHDSLVANPRMLPLISHSHSKDDRTDACILARLRRADPKLLSAVYHRTEQQQIDIGVIRARVSLVGVRTTLINHVRGAVKSFGARLPRCSADSFANKVRDAIPPELVPALSPLVDQVAELTKQVRRFDRQIEELCSKRYPETARLRQIKGVGPITSLAFVLTIGDPRRFPNSRTVGSYLGLRPRRNESGNSSPELRITKAGDSMLRRLLVQSAHYILGRSKQDSDLQRWGMKLSMRGRKRAKKVAVVAVARKLAVLLHRLWITGTDYEPLRNANRRSLRG